MIRSPGRCRDDPASHSIPRIRRSDPCTRVVRSGEHRPEDGLATDCCPRGRRTTDRPGGALPAGCVADLGGPRRRADGRDGAAPCTCHRCPWPGARGPDSRRIRSRDARQPLVTTTVRITASRPSISGRPPRRDSHLPPNSKLWTTYSSFPSATSSSTARYRTSRLFRQLDCCTPRISRRFRSHSVCEDEEAMTTMDAVHPESWFMP